MGGAVTYAGPLPILDADSHVMELSDFLDDHIDPDQRDRLHRDRRDVARGDERDAGVEEGVTPLGAGEAGGVEGFRVDRLPAPCARLRHGDIVSPRR